MDVQHSSRARRLRAVGAGLAVIAALVAGTALASAADPPGNNGTVKIHDGAGEPSPITRDDPKVCTFHLHFLFADGGQAGTWEIEAWPPGGGRDVVLSGSYRTEADGEDRQPEAGAYGLPDGHYKLSWEGTTDRTLKHKVFWVSCAAASPSPSHEPSPSPHRDPSPSPSPAASAEGSASPPASPSASPSPSGTGGVLDIVVTPPPTTTAVALAGAPTGTVELVVLLLLVFSAAVQAIRLVAVLGIRSR